MYVQRWHPLNRRNRIMHAIILKAVDWQKMWGSGGLNLRGGLEIKLWYICSTFCSDILYRRIRRFQASPSADTSTKSEETITAGSGARSFSALYRTLMCYPSGTVLSLSSTDYRLSIEIQTQDSHSGLLPTDFPLTRRINYRPCLNVFSVCLLRYWLNTCSRIY